MNKQNVEVQITLNYYDQSAEPIDGRLQPSSERVMRDLYEMLRDGKTIPYQETRTTAQQPITEGTSVTTSSFTQRFPGNTSKDYTINPEIQLELDI